MVINTIFNNISVILCWSVHWLKKPEYPKKTTNLPQLTDKLYHIMLYQVPFMCKIYMYNSTIHSGTLSF